MQVYVCLHHLKKFSGGGGPKVFIVSDQVLYVRFMLAYADFCLYAGLHRLMPVYITLRSFLLMVVLKCL